MIVTNKTHVRCRISRPVLVAGMLAALSMLAACAPIWPRELSKSSTLVTEDKQSCVDASDTATLTKCLDQAVEKLETIQYAILSYNRGAAYVATAAGAYAGLKATRSNPNTQLLKNIAIGMAVLFGFDQVVASEKQLPAVKAGLDAMTCLRDSVTAFTHASENYQQFSKGLDTRPTSLHDSRATYALSSIEAIVGSTGSDASMYFASDAQGGKAALRQDQQEKFLAATENQLQQVGLIDRQAKASAQALERRKGIYSLIFHDAVNADKAYQQAVKTGDASLAYNIKTHMFGILREVSVQLMASNPDYRTLYKKQQGAVTAVVQDLVDTENQQDAAISRVKGLTLQSSDKGAPTPEQDIYAKCVTTAADDS